MYMSLLTYYKKYIIPTRGEKFDHNDEQRLIWLGLRGFCNKTLPVASVLHMLVECDGFTIERAAFLMGVTTRGAKRMHKNIEKSIQMWEDEERAKQPWPPYDLNHEYLTEKIDSINGWNRPPDNAF